jgi:Mg2+ and Co2+ transporter CorA
MATDLEHADRDGADGTGLRIRMFDADRKDRALTFEEALDTKASQRQLLWIDIEGELELDRLRALAAKFELDPETARSLATRETGPSVELHGGHFHVRVAAEPNPDRRGGAHWLDIVAAKNVVISQHEQPIALLDQINGRIAADATIGELDSAEFVASVLDAILTRYHAAVDALEDELDEIDAEALTRPRTTPLFAKLVDIRHRISRLRRVLAAHRELFGSLGRPDFGRGVRSADPDVFVAVANRYESVLVSLESVRDVVLGSFDILMTRTAQRTNDVMRALTLATVMALPATVTAGFLGMNVIVPVPNDNPASFWLIAAAVVLFELVLFAVARWRRWI